MGPVILFAIYHTIYQL